MNIDDEFEFEAFDFPAAFEDDEELSRFRRFAPRARINQPRIKAPRVNVPRPRPRPRPRPPRIRYPVIGRRTYLQAPDSPGSEYVRWVQTMLNLALNLQLPVDGVLSVETRSAIRSFQEKNGLPVTGIVGPDTERALQAAGAQSPEPAPAQAADQPPDQEFGDWELETPVSFAGFPQAVLDALKRGLESVAVQLAVAGGARGSGAGRGVRRVLRRVARWGVRWPPPRADGPARGIEPRPSACQRADAPATPATLDAASPAAAVAGIIASAA